MLDCRVNGFGLDSQKTNPREAGISSFSSSTTPPSEEKTGRFEDASFVRQVKETRGEYQGAVRAYAAADRAREAAQVVASAVARRASFVAGISMEGTTDVSLHPQVASPMPTRTTVAADVERQQSTGASHANAAPTRKPVMLARLTKEALMQHTARSLPLSVGERLVPKGG